jgi:hypothetical protein
MKRVWKCDFCYKTDVDKDVMERHENECHFNPINKRCSTCEHREPMDYSMDYECAIHDMGWYVDVDDGDKDCDDWTNEEERARKIKQIKNKLNG